MSHGQKDPRIPTKRAIRSGWNIRSFPCLIGTNVCAHSLLFIFAPWHHASLGSFWTRTKTKQRSICVGKVQFFLYMFRVRGKVGRPKTGASNGFYTRNGNLQHPTLAKVVSAEFSLRKISRRLFAWRFPSCSKVIQWWHGWCVAVLARASKSDLQKFDVPLP